MTFFISDVETRATVPEDNISGPLKTAIYKISREALNNVAKHSETILWPFL